jgi:bifunctional non-homologous end joining protein LigD
VGNALAKPPKSVRKLSDERFSIDSVDGLLGLVEMGAVELLAANVTIDDLERPDMLVFSVTAADTALRLRTLLQAEGLESWPKLTGSRELHVMVPVEPDLNEQEALRYSEQLAGRLGNANIDCRYNMPGATAIAAFSPRALPGLPIAAPVEWTQLQRGLAPDAFTIKKRP